MSGGRPDLVVAIFPNTRGFGFAVFEGLLPVDWGVSEAQGNNRHDTCLRRVANLLGKYSPDVVLLRDPGEARGPRISALIEAIALLPPDVTCLAVSRLQVREAFAHLGRPTRHRIACAVADRIPFFKPLLPPPRKIWMSESRRMGLFDALALALTYLDDGIGLTAPG